MKVKLNENALKSIISESIRNVLREFDEPFPYNYSDAREREDYFRRAVQADFPAKFSQGKVEHSWESTYYRYKDEQMDIDKQKAKEERARQKELRAQEKENAKYERLEKKNYSQNLYKDAVFFTFGGDDAFLDFNKMSEEDWENYETKPGAIGGKWYDGVSKLPIYLKGENESPIKIIAEVTGVGYGDPKYTYGDYEYDMFMGSVYTFSGGWGLDWGEGENDWCYIKYIVKISEYAKQIDFTITEINNPNVLKGPTRSAIKKYLNALVMRNYYKLKAAGHTPTSKY